MPRSTTSARPAWGVSSEVERTSVPVEVIAGDAAANPWAGLKWPAVPGHYGKPWFLPIVGAYYRYQDWRH